MLQFDFGLNEDHCAGGNIFYKFNNFYWGIEWCRKTTRYQQQGKHILWKFFWKGKMVHAILAFQEGCKVFTGSIIYTEGLELL